MHDEIQLQLQVVLYSTKTGYIMWRECWIWGKHDKKRPDPAHMRYLRNTWGFSRKDCVEDI
jgi:hypothetical protein